MRILEEGTKDLFRLEWWLEFLALASLGSLLAYVLGQTGSRKAVFFWIPLVVLLVQTGFALIRWQLRKREVQRTRDEIARLLEAWEAQWTEPKERLQELPPHTGAIDELYVDLRHLQAQETTPQTEQKIRERLQQIRRLQREDAEWMQQRFESRLYLKPGDGWRALEAAKRLLEHEDPAPSNSPAAREN